MAQYLLSVWHDGPYPELPEDETEAMFKSVGEFNQEIMANGTWVFGGGLEEPDTATVVDASGADVVTTDGPFSEAKEQIGGFWVIQAPDLDAALAIATKASAACRGKVEVRPFQGE